MASIYTSRTTATASRILYNQARSHPVFLCQKDLVIHGQKFYSSTSEKGPPKPPLENGDKKSDEANQSSPYGLKKFEKQFDKVRKIMDDLRVMDRELVLYQLKSEISYYMDGGLWLCLSASSLYFF